MIEKFQDWLLEQDIHDVAYWGIIGLYYIVMIAVLAINGWIFNNWCMVILGSIVMNTIRQYSGGFHCTTLVRCILFTNLMFVIFGFAAKYSPYCVTIPLVVISVAWILYKTPVIETDYKEMSNRWHKEQVLAWCVIFICIAIVIQVIGFSLIASNILWSIVLVGALCFKNPIKTNTN